MTPAGAPLRPRGGEPSGRIVAARAGARRPSGRRRAACWLAASPSAPSATPRRPALFFGALTRIDASLAALLLYDLPRAGLRRRGRARPRARRPAPQHAPSATGDRRRRARLLGGGAGALDARRRVLALGAAVAYASLRPARRPRRRAVDAFCSRALIDHRRRQRDARDRRPGHRVACDLGFEPRAAGCDRRAGLALCTVLPMSAFLRRPRHVGPATATIVSTSSPSSPWRWRWSCSASALGPVQLAGGAPRRSPRWSS